MDQVHTVIVGAGVVGLAAACAIARAGREVLLLEALEAFGQGVSARSSEVIHAGLYYAPGSLKARLCVAGREFLYAYAAARGIGHRRCGKLVVATESAQAGALVAMCAHAGSCGVEALELLEARAAQAMEPALRCAAALWSPATGIVDSHALMLALLGEAEDHGALLALRSPVERVRVIAGGGFEVEVGGAARMRLGARALVNAAGLHACALARAVDGLDARHVPAPHWARGHYFACSARAPFSRLIYPLPEPGGLGIHLTLDLAGQARFGPDVQWLPVAPRGGEDYRIDPALGPAFERSVRRYWPALPVGALQPAYAGIRPKIAGPGEPAADFRIDGPERHGVPGLVNLFGIESPGLTASLAIGEHVAALLREGS